MPAYLDTLTRAQLEAAGALDYCRWLQCLTDSGGQARSASSLFLARFPGAFNRDIVRKSLDTMNDSWFTTKAAVAPGLTTDPAWAGALVGAPPELTQAFIGYTNRVTLLGRIPQLLRAPFGVPIPILTSGANYGWTGEGRPKVVSAMAFASTTIPPAKCAGTIVVSEELLKVAPGTAELLRGVLASGLAAFLDIALTDPANAAVLGIRPASWTNNALAVTSTGDAKQDVAALIRAFVAQPYKPIAPVLLLPWDVASELDPEGKLGLGIDSVGTYGAMPAIVSPHISVTVVADAAAIPVADAAAFGVDVARHATIEMSAPPMDPPTAATVHTSLWQSNLIAVRAEWIISWSRPIAASVAYLAAETP